MLLADSGTPAEAIPYLQRFAREAPRDRYASDIARVAGDAGAAGAAGPMTSDRRRPVARRRSRRWLDADSGWRSRRCVGLPAEATEPARAPIAAGALRGSNVLLVTIDTLRADRVGAYGSTQRADADDRSASRRTACASSARYAHVPLTLPSHASLLTASYPTTNGVHDNGTFRLGACVADARRGAEARRLPHGAPSSARSSSTPASASDAASMSTTIACIGRGGDVEFVQRSAEQVLAPAYEWITSLGGSADSPRSRVRRSPQPQSPAPWFAWVHLYDPHEPYAPPEPYRSRYAVGALRRRDRVRRRRARHVRRSPAPLERARRTRSWSSPRTTASRSASTASGRTACSPTTPRCACR